MSTRSTRLSSQLWGSALAPSLAVVLLNSPFARVVAIAVVVVSVAVVAIAGSSRRRALFTAVAVPVLVAQATAPSLTAPLVAAFPALEVFLLCGAAAAIALLFLLPLRLPRT